MYERQFRQKQQQLQKADQIKKEKEEQKLHNELLNVTFKPQIASSNIPVKTSFYERNQKYSEAYKNRQKIYQNPDDQIAEQCTFHPSINPVSQYICDSKLKRKQQENLHEQILQSENISQQVDLLEKLRQTKKQAKIQNSVKLQKQTQQLYKKLEESQRQQEQNQVQTLYPSMSRAQAIRRQQLATQLAYEGSRIKQKPVNQSINLDAIKYNQDMTNDRNQDWLKKYNQDKDEIKSRRDEEIKRLKDREMDQCTFNPQIDINSKYIAQNKKSLVQSYQEFKQQHDQVIERLYQKQLHDELKDCTFKPKLTENSDITIEDSFTERQEKLLAHQKQRKTLQTSGEIGDQEQLEAELTIIKCNQFKHTPAPNDKTYLMLKDEQDVLQKSRNPESNENNYLSRIGGTDVNIGMKNLDSINKTVKRLRAQREIADWNQYYQQQ